MNRIIHFDISADDPEKVADFYRNVFGWEISKWEMPPASEEEMEEMRKMMGLSEGTQIDTRYWNIITGPDSEPGINGGLSKRMSKVGSQKAFINTIGVTDLEESIKKIESAGGQITMPKMAIPGVGWFAQAKDPDGNYFGIMQDDKEAK